MQTGEARKGAIHNWTTRKDDKLPKHLSEAQGLTGNRWLTADKGCVDVGTQSWGMAGRGEPGAHR